MFSIIDLKTGALIGAGGLLYINWIIRSADFSFYIGKDEAYIDKEGYSADAAALLIEYGFNNLNLHKIWMELYEFDHTKIDFFKEKFQFEVDGTLRNNCFEDGRYWNSYIISLIKK
jgi:RimJ/RimL family protein N-acetyltransferase